MEPTRRLDRAVARRVVLAGALAALGAGAVQPLFAAGRSGPPKVLFVCQFGTVKSAVAREHLRRRAADRGIAIQVHSRGITPEPHRSAALTEALRQDGIDPDREPLGRLTPGDIAAADIVIVFDKLPAGFHAQGARDWSDLPSMNADYPAARTNLLKRINALLDELTPRQRPQSATPDLPQR